MKWEQLNHIDDIFNHMNKMTILLNDRDSENYDVNQLLYNNNKTARMKYTSGVRDIVTKEQISLANDVSENVTNAMKLIASTCNGELVGLEFKIKSEESLNRKLRDYEGALSNGNISARALEAAVKDTHDVLRFTILFNEDSFVKDFMRSRKLLEQKHMKFVKIKNTFGNVKTYKGVNTFVLAESDKHSYIYELQFHTRSSFNAKMSTHEFYEIERNSNSSKEQISKAIAAQEDIFSKVNAPYGYELIQNIDYLSEEKVGIVS